jgi:hypothetical protein
MCGLGTYRYLVVGAQSQNTLCSATQYGMMFGFPV